VVVAVAYGDDSQPAHRKVFHANADRPRFVAVEGPKGVGKTSLCRGLADTMVADVVVTKEPTPAFDLSQEERLSGLALATAIAEDRRRHVDQSIAPALARGSRVVCDRYILSSLVFHTLDGLSWDEIWALNRTFPLPDVNVLVLASAKALTARRQDRATTRLQAAVDPETELAAYRDQAKRLEDRGCACKIIYNGADQRQAIKELAALLEPTT
jgi:dTMP kinase